MLLSIFEDIEKKADSFKEFLTEDGHQYYMALIFAALIVIFLFGFNAVHKHDK